MLTKPKVFDCDNYISNSEGERKNQRLNFSIHIYKHLQEKKKSHTTMIYVRLHSIPTDDLQEFCTAHVFKN